MTTEEILERLIEKGHKAYKRNFRYLCPILSRMLDRKEPVMINDVEYRCWQELVIHNIGLLIQEFLPNTQCEVMLDYNNSYIIVGELTEADEEVIMTKLRELVEK